MGRKKRGGAQLIRTERERVRERETQSVSKERRGTTTKKMADTEHDTEFESADAGASTTYPNTAGAVRKNGFIVIKGRPCKVVDVTTSKTGKHGHAKCHFTALDIFTQKKMEMLESSSHNVEIPNVTRYEYSLLDIDEDFVSLMDDNGDTRDDLKMPEDADLASKIQKDFDDGKELVVTVQKAMNEEQIMSFKEAVAGK